MIDFGYGIQLTTVDESHLNDMRDARNDYSTWKWCRQPSLILEQQHKQWFDWQAKDSNTAMYSIRHELVNFVGVCGLTGVDWVNRRAEFSLYIAPFYRGKGKASAALKTLFSHGFNDLNLNLIWGETFDGNPAYDLFLKLGMKHEGTRRDFYFKDGKYIDAHLISLRRDEWTSPQRP